MLQFASLGSGSRGNATLIKSGAALLMVDCGFTIKETEKRLRRLGHQPEDVSAILVTHEHGDHIKGVAPFARKYGCAVYATHGTSQYKDLYKVDGFQLVNCRHQFRVEGLEVTPVAVPHDAREPCQYLFRRQQKSVGVLTDLGSITPHVIEQYRHCDALMLEFNHDPRMLSVGPYPPSVKQRVGSRWGHLSNQQAANFLQHVELLRLQHLVVSHISEQNNTEQLAREALVSVCGEMAVALMADQSEGLPWLKVE